MLLLHRSWNCPHCKYPPVRWPRTTAANPVTKTTRSDSGNPRKKKFLLPLPTSTNEQTRSKNIGYLNVKNVSLSPASLSRPPDRRGFRGEHFFLRGTTFRLLAGISAHSRRTAHTFPGPITGQNVAKNSENRTFPKTFGALLQAAAADDTRL